MTEYWKADAESGDKRLEWAKQTVAADDRIKIVSSPVTQGTKSYRVELRHGDNPSGCRAMVATGPSAMKGWGPVHILKPNDEAYYGFSVLLPSATFPKLDRWRLLIQWKGIHTGSPPVSLNIKSDKWLLNNKPTASGSIIHRWTSLVHKDAWEKFVLHAKWSSDPKVGFIELYYNGQMVLPKLMTSTMHIVNGQTVNNIISYGIYRDSSITSTDVVFHDGFVVGKTYDEVTQ